MHTYSKLVDMGPSLLSTAPAPKKQPSLLAKAAPYLIGGGAGLLGAYGLNKYISNPTNNPVYQGLEAKVTPKIQSGVNDALNTFNKANTTNAVMSTDAAKAYLTPMTYNQDVASNTAGGIRDNLDIPVAASLPASLVNMTANIAPTKSPSLLGKAWNSMGSLVRQPGGQPVLDAAGKAVPSLAGKVLGKGIPLVDMTWGSARDIQNSMSPEATSLYMDSNTDANQARMKSLWQQGVPGVAGNLVAGASLLGSAALPTVGAVPAIGYALGRAGIDLKKSVDAAELQNAEAGSNANHQWGNLLMDLYKKTHSTDQNQQGQALYALKRIMDSKMLQGDNLQSLTQNDPAINTLVNKVQSLYNDR